MKYLLVSAAILCMLLTAGCGNEQLSENSAEISATEEIENSAEISSAEETESPTENIETSDVVDDVTVNDDVSYIPKNAAYKSTKYLVYDGESMLNEINYFDEFGNAIRIISYMDGELLDITDMENEYNSDGQLVRATESSIGFGDYSAAGESFVELEYNEKGGLKKMTSSQNEEVLTVAYEYEYDEQGRPIAVTEYFNGSDESLSTTYKTYDENGNVATEKTDFNGKMEIEDYYQYDEKGRIVREENNKSNSLYYYEYEYEDYKDFTLTRPDGITY